MELVLGRLGINHKLLNYYGNWAGCIEPLIVWVAKIWQPVPSPPQAVNEIPPQKIQKICKAKSPSVIFSKQRGFLLCKIQVAPSNSRHEIAAS